MMVFFTFSTTQEYYSMPIYPALALLLGRRWRPRNAALRSGFAVEREYSRGLPVWRR